MLNFIRISIISVICSTTVSCACVEAMAEQQRQLAAQKHAQYLENLKQECRQFGFQDDTVDFSRCLQERDQFNKQQAAAKAQESQRQLDNIMQENKENMQKTMDSLKPKTTRCKPDIFGGLVCQ